jgi:hypothetical protein
VLPFPCPGRGRRYEPRLHARRGRDPVQRRKRVQSPGEVEGCG